MIAVRCSVFGSVYKNVLTAPETNVGLNSLIIFLHLCPYITFKARQDLPLFDEAIHETVSVLCVFHQQNLANPMKYIITCCKLGTIQHQRKYKGAKEIRTEDQFFSKKTRNALICGREHESMNTHVLILL